MTNPHQTHRLWALAAPALALTLAFAAPAARAVVLDEENKVEIVLDDGTHLTLYGEADTSVGKAPNPPPPNLIEYARKALGEPDSELASAQTRGIPGANNNNKGKAQPAANSQAPMLAGKLGNIGRLPVNNYKKTTRFYYLPPGLHLSKRPDGTPEFLFLKFTTENTEEQGGVSGALMHFLVEWGLSPKQMTEARAKLKSKVPNGQLMGAVDMEPDGDAGGFTVVSATLGDKAMATSVITSGKAPLVPGGKAAVAARLTANGAQLLAATFEKARSITDVSLAVDLGYTTLSPAAKGSIT
ncbi:MAG TPA: hypothetical protein VGV61_14405, partial [Thermoanaerobaculia bacterium]|nr:hypothetical protein [Thermoanaerobaculia bacterium]